MSNVTLPTGISIEYERRGQGQPILFVMGLGGQLTAWTDEFLDQFVAAGYEAICFDNRDSGLSSQTDWEPPSQRRSIWSMLTRRPLSGVGYTIDDMADDAAALLTELGIEQAHIVGASMGGMIAQALTIRHPDRIMSLCSIMSNTGDRKNGTIALSLLRHLKDFEGANRETAVDDAVKSYLLMAGEHSDEAVYRPRAQAAVERSYAPEGLARQTAAIGGSPDRTEALGGVNAPTLVIHGLQDPLVKPSGGTATAKAIPGARLLMFPDMGHDIPSNRVPEIVAAMTQNFERALAAQPA